MPYVQNIKKSTDGRSTMTSSPTTSSTSEDEEYDPQPRAGTSRRQGFTVAKKRMSTAGQTAGRSTPRWESSTQHQPDRPLSREALRKANHSLIERRRREKINTALGELRNMVPGLNEGSTGKAGEFKLEVLERTVEHMRVLERRINELELQLRSPSTAPPAKRRKRSQEFKDEAAGRNGHRGVTTNTYSQMHEGIPIPSSPLSPPRSALPRSTSDSDETEAEHYSPIAMIADTPTSLHLTYDSGQLLSLRDIQASIPTQRYNQSAVTPRTALDVQAGDSEKTPADLGNSMAVSSSHQSQKICLPFPSPSPTSPFVTYLSHSSSTTSGSTGRSEPIEPSPFLAPIADISLFGGILSPDGTLSPPLGMRLYSTTEVQGTQEWQRPHTMPASAVNADEKDTRRQMAPEEAANLLLAFSSPDTLRAVGEGKDASGGLKGSALSAQESEHFVLDGGRQLHNRSHSLARSNDLLAVTKTARDILNM